MRKPIIAGNWKMYKTLPDALQLVRELKEGLEKIRGIEKVVCPTFPVLAQVSELLKGTSIGVGAQNMFWEDEGAYTGEVSAPMIEPFCQYVIL